MLLDMVQGIEAGGFIIIQDSVNYSGRRLLKSFIKAALDRAEVVHVLGFDVSEEELNDGLNGSSIQRLHFHNAYLDPLGWTEDPPFTIQQFSAEEIANLVKQTPQSKPVTLVIDSISWVLRHQSPFATCKCLQQLKKGGAVRTVIGLLHSDLHQHGIVGSVGHLATAVITLTPGLRGYEATAKTTRRLKSGKVMQHEDVFTIKDDLTITVQSKPSQPGTMQADPGEPEADPAANLTFNLRLSNTEREAKEKLSLPFVFSKEKKSVLLKSGPGSGRILYEPDANDDYDQEDPDDDLDV